MVEPSPEPRVRQFVRVSGYVLLVAYASLVVRDFYTYVGRYPFVSVDDGLANVSHTLATVGRLGFLSSPIQGMTDIPRHVYFLNYGPWYFWFGALLIWLFGYSLTILRSIHLLVICAAALTAVCWFRRSLIPTVGSACAFALLYIFDVAHWPMVRPDIAVSAFAVVLFIAAGVAASRRSGWAWFIAAAAAGCAALTHLIAWALVPAAAALFLADRLGAFGDSYTSRAARAFVAGGIFSAVMFYAAIGFHIGNHLAALRAYRTFLAVGQNTGGYWHALGTHLAIAFSFLGPRQRMALAWWLGLGVILAGLAAWRSADARRAARIYALPPLAVLVAYGASLGNYPNYHSGYAILLQVAAVWLLAGTLATLSAVRIRSWPLAPAIGVLVGVLVLGATTWAAAAKVVETSAKAKTADEWVDIAGYISRVTEVLPVGSRAWGTLFFGSDAPSRVQLVQVGEGVMATERAEAAVRPLMAPEYLIWGYPENRDGVLLGLRGHPNQLERVQQLFPTIRYRLVSMVDGPPYGTTRVFQRVAANAGQTPATVDVAAYDRVTHAWDRSVSAAQPLALQASSAPLKLRIGFSGALIDATAQQTRATTLPPGDYLLTVGVRTGTAPARERALLATPTASLEQTIGETGPSFDVGLYSPSDTDVHVFIRHRGGPLFIAQFDTSDGADITGVRASLVSGMHDFGVERRDQQFQPIAAAADWHADAGVSIRQENGRLYVEGDDSQMGYQLETPVVPVPLAKDVLLRVSYSTEAGRVCVGALTGNGSKWILPPTESKAEYQFNTLDATNIMVVLANCNFGAGPRVRSRFVIDSARLLTHFQNELYTDLLMRYGRF